MRSQILAAVLGAAFVPAICMAAPGIQLAFYGWQSAPVGCFDESGSEPAATIDLRLADTSRPGGGHLFGIRSWGLIPYGCNLPNTEEDEGCGGYDLTAWFEPGSVVIGHLSPADQNCIIEGEEWQGHIPTDFDSIRLEMRSGAPCDSMRTLMVPVRWLMPSSVPDRPRLSWGRLRLTYQE